MTDEPTTLATLDVPTAVVGVERPLPRRRLRLLEGEGSDDVGRLPVE